MKYKEILKLMYPKKFVVKYTNDTYEGIVWNTLDATTNPTKAELDAAIAKYTEAGRVLQSEDESRIVLPDTGVVPGTYANVTVDAMGRVLGGQALTSSDVVAALGFLPADTSGQVKILSSYTGVTNAISGTSLIPADNTVPLITEGTQLWSQSVTPGSLASKFMVDQVFMLGTSTANRQITVALFRGSECIYVNSTNLASVGRTAPTYIHAIDTPNSAAPVTYSLRIGVNSSATWYVNVGGASVYTFGGVANASDWSILEIN
jgi:hypothetical protein